MFHIVLVNYNGTADTIACIRSLQEMNGGALTLTVVDNASRFEQAAALRDWGQEIGLFEDMLRASRVGQGCDVLAGVITGRDGPITVNLIFSPRNLGFAGGNNIGIELALADPCMTHVWILNNDTEVDADALAALLRRMADDPTIGMCGSTLVYFDHRDMVQALGGRFNSRLARPEQLAALSQRDALPSQDSIERHLAYVVGASMLVSRAFLETVGVMDDRYFLYFEEIDWAERGKRSFKLGWAPDSIVYHKEGGAIGTSSRSRPSDLSLYYMSRSSLRFLRRHHPLLLPVGLARLAGKATTYWVKGDRKAALVMMRAMLHFATNRMDARPAT